MTRTMELGVEEFIDGLLSKEAHEQPSDKEKPEDTGMRIPDWFDEKKYNRGRKFYWEHSFYFTSSMLMGLIAVFAIPSILRVLIGSRRSNSLFTSYRRYLSTLLHTVSWFEYDLKPGSVSWNSLMTVRSRHFKAGVAAQLKGQGTVSQRDLALTQFGFVGFSILKPDKFGICQRSDDDWEAYNHFWRVIGHAIGLEDKYNLCRPTVDETREVCQILLDRVFTPCLENVPEYFEHMARAMLDGQSTINPTIHIDGMLYWTKYLANVPGYFYTEEERIDLQRRIKKQLKGKSSDVVHGAGMLDGQSTINPTIHIDGMLYWTKYLANVPGYFYTEEERIDLQRRIKKQLKGKSSDVGVDASSLIEKCAIEGLPERKPRLLYLRDYNTLDSSPAYARLDKAGKTKLAFYYISTKIYTTWWGRWYFNMNFTFSLLLMKYLPFLSFLRYGIRASYVNIFCEDPIDDTEPKPNAEYYKTKPPVPWYKELWSLIW